MSMTPVIDVAKKKPAPKDKTRKPMVAQLRGSAAWKAWIEELADFDDRAVASLFERAVHRYAKEVGFPKEPPER
jgi:hypothetical protein